MLGPVEELGLDYRMLREGILPPGDDNVATYVVPHASYRDRLQRHEKMVQQVLTKTSGTAIETLQFVAASEVLEEES